MNVSNMNPNNKPPLPRIKKGNKTIPLPIYNKSEIKVNNENKKCSPIFSFEDNSCIPLKFLIKMAQTYNEHFDDNIGEEIGIAETYDKEHESSYKIYLLKEFQDRFGQDQQDWIKQNFMKYMEDEYKLLFNDYTFRPEGPTDKHKWLSQIDIDKVIQQYEILHPDYHYLGCLPADHIKLNNYETKNLNFEKHENKGITKFSFVSNTDRHTERGQHWRMLYIDIVNGYIYFIDSVGNDPINDDLEFINKVIKYLKDKQRPIIYKINKTEHQKGNSNCGVYGIYFTEQFLLGKSFEEITNTPIPDKIMDECRKIYFSEH